MEPDVDHISITEAARILGVDRASVQRRLVRGTLAGRHVDGRWAVERQIVEVEAAETATAGGRIVRPRIPEGPTRSTTIATRLTAAELDWLRAAAEAEGESMSVYLRSLVQAAMRDDTRDRPGR